MKTKTELAEFIRKVADSEHKENEWEVFAVAHYSDESMENARREMVKYKLGYGCPHEMMKPALYDIAMRLESS